MLDHLQETIQHPPYLTHIVGHTSLRADSIRFVEEIDAANIINRIEDLAQQPAVSPMNLVMRASVARKKGGCRAHPPTRRQSSFCLCRADQPVAVSDVATIRVLNSG